MDITLDLHDLSRMPGPVGRCPCGGGTLTGYLNNGHLVLGCQELTHPFLKSKGPQPREAIKQPSRKVDPDEFDPRPVKPLPGQQALPGFGE